MPLILSQSHRFSKPVGSVFGSVPDSLFVVSPLHTFLVSAADTCNVSMVQSTRTHIEMRLPSPDQAGNVPEIELLYTELHKGCVFRDMRKQARPLTHSSHSRPWLTVCRIVNRCVNSYSDSTRQNEQ